MEVGTLNILQSHTSSHHLQWRIPARRTVLSPTPFDQNLIRASKREACSLPQITRRGDFFILATFCMKMDKSFQLQAVQGLQLQGWIPNSDLPVPPEPPEAVPLAPPQTRVVRLVRALVMVRLRHIRCCQILCTTMS